MSDIDVKLTLRADSSGLTGQVNRATAAVSGTERALKNSSKQAGNFERATAGASQGAAKQATSVGELAREHRQATSAMQQSQQMQQRQGTLANAFARGIQVQKGALSQLSYQLQDVAVQSQMGTNNLIILGQQGPQILSLFGPLGAVAGVAVAVGAAVSGIGLAASGSSSQIKSLADALDALNSSFEDNSNGAETLSSDIIKLADDSVAAARLKIQTQIDAAKQTLTTARNELGAMLSELGGDPVLSATDKLAGITRYDKVAEEMKLSVEDVKSLYDALPDVGEKLDASAYERLIVVVQDLRQKYMDSSPALNQFSAYIAESGLEAKQAADKVQQAQQALADFDAAIELAKTDSLQTDITPEMAERNWLAEFYEEQDAGQRKANESAQHQLAIIEAQNQALRGGATAQEAQAIAQDEQLRLQLQQAGVTDEFIAKLLEARKTQRELTAQTKTDNNTATVNAQAQLTAIEAKNEALRGGATLQEAQAAAQEQQLRAQLQAAGVADELIDSIIAAQRAQQALVAAQKDQGVITQLKQQYALQQKNSKEVFIQSELAKLSADATDKQKEKVKELAAELYDQTEGQRAADTMQQDFERAMESVAASLTDALISGDWEGTGQQIGSVLGAAIGGAVYGPVGAAVGGAIGGSLFADSPDRDPTAGRQARQNTGDVLGGINDKSQSIAEYTQQTADALGELIGVNRELLAAQQGADQSIGAFAAEAARAIDVYEKYSSKITDIGIQFGPEGAELYASGKGISADVLAELYPDIASELISLTEPYNAAVNSIGDVLSQSAETLGIELSGEFNAALLDLGKISLEGLSAEEFEEVISQTFGTGLNQAADQLIPDIQSFVDEVGESSGQVLQEFARNATVVDGALLGLNDSLADLTGLEFGDAATNLVGVFGDAAGLAAASQRLADEFLSDEKKAELNEQKLRKELDQLNEKYKDLNIQLPETKDGIAELIYGLDLKTEAGRAALEVFTRSSGALVEFYQTAETGAAEALASIQSATDAAYSAFGSSVNQRIRDINEQLAAERAALQAQKNSAIEAARLSTESARTRVRVIENELRDIESAYDRLAQQAGVGLDRDTAFDQLQLAASGGELTDIGEALAAAQNINADEFATVEDYAREQRTFLAVLEKVEDKSQGQLSAAEQQLNAANRQISVIEDSFDEQIMTLEEAAEEEQKRLEELLEDQQAQLNELRGIDESVQSVDDSIKALQAALIAEQKLTQQQLAEQQSQATETAHDDFVSSQSVVTPEVGAHLQRAHALASYTHGSHADGLTRVPFDGYRAELHRDEMVLTADVANAVRRSVGAGSGNNDMAGEIARLRAELADLKSLIRAIAAHSSATANTLEDIEMTGLIVREA